MVFYFKGNVLRPLCSLVFVVDLIGFYVRLTILKVMISQRKTQTHMSLGFTKNKTRKVNLASWAVSRCFLDLILRVKVSHRGRLLARCWID